MLPRPLEPGTSLAFQPTSKRGAVLVTKYPTFREDSLLEAAFEEYTRRHYDSWAVFARKKQYGDIQPVLVSGFDMTRDFAMVALACSNGYFDNPIKFTVAVQTVSSPPPPVWGTWRTDSSSHTNCGPMQHSPPHKQVIDIPSSVNVGSIPSEFNQCVFIRYYTMRPRIWPMFSKVFQASAGSHGLVSRDAYLGWPVRSSAKPTTSDDVDLGGQQDPTTDDTDSEPDTTVRNNSHVWFLSLPEDNPPLSDNR